MSCFKVSGVVFAGEFFLKLQATPRKWPTIPLGVGIRSLGSRHYTTAPVIRCVDNGTTMMPVLILLHDVYCIDF